MRRRRPLKQLLIAGLELVWMYLRVQRPLTRLLGPAHPVNRRCIGIDITWRCNVKCHSCNRSCRQAPCDGAGDMSLAQIERFIAESAERGTIWQRLRVLGGEPTLHPQLPEIMLMLARYCHRTGDQTYLGVVTNGVAGADVLAALPPKVEVESSRKDIYSLPFIPFNLAPRDTAWRYSDFGSACWIAASCGLGLNSHGYYICGIAGGIDRVLGLDLGRKSLPADDDDLADQLHQLCPWCGHFRYPSRRLFYSGSVSRRSIMSASWQRAYQEYAASPPRLTRY